MDRKLDNLLYSLMQSMTVAVSGEKLARELGVSHSTLIHRVNRLRDHGVEIRGELFTGFRLERLPDVLLPQLIRPRLRTSILGKNIYHFYEVNSTNDFARRLLGHGTGAPEGTLVLAERQTAGRGRMGRNWFSESGSGLYFSVVLKPRVPAQYVPLLTLGAAVAVHDAVERCAGVDVDIKWPNDLLVGKRKVCGILAEMQAEVDNVQTLIMGVGLNVNHQAMPDELADRATSLRLATGRRHSRIEILVESLEELEKLLERFHKEGPSAITEPWSRSSSFTEGRSIEVRDGFRSILGVTRGLHPSGALRVEQADGSIEEVYSGDVIRWS